MTFESSSLTLFLSSEGRNNLPPSCCDKTSRDAFERGSDSVGACMRECVCLCGILCYTVCVSTYVCVIVCVCDFVCV